MSPDRPIKPRNFYLNEQHELARTEKKGGGRVPTYVGIDWAAKGTSLNNSLREVRQQIQKSTDPTKEHHYFVLASPVEQVAKKSTSQKAKNGRILEATEFAMEHSKVFRRLGIDLLRVAGDGSALVHMKPETAEQLASRTRDLSNLGAAEQSRWATIEGFGLVPAALRVDAEWLDSLPANKPIDAVIEFQPLLSRGEVDSLIRSLAEILRSALGELISTTGVDFSGRHWIRGRIASLSLRSIAERYFSIQSLHSPLTSVVAGRVSSAGIQGPGPLGVSDNIQSPAIGVVDRGVPAHHAILTRFRRGTYTSPTASHSIPQDHGAFVASRIVFGDFDPSGAAPAPSLGGQAAYFDVNVGAELPPYIDDKAVIPALQAIVATAPDVRVFNLSFDTERPLNLISSVKRSEFLILVQDLDNFIFQSDVIVVVAAGNSRPGLLPNPTYPKHYEDPEWAMGAWAQSFNALTCGSYVGRPSPGGYVGKLGWPSPFCRVGPGLCGSPKPDFSANGGDSGYNYQPVAGLGVSGLTAHARWENRAGTSFAAPLLARQAAFAVQALNKFCEGGAQPFAVTIKAFLAITATPPVTEQRIRKLIALTLGHGTASSARLDSPDANSALMIWQGLLDDSKDTARIQIPIPAAWLAEAQEPRLRLVVAWDPPANAAVFETWATRRVSAKLRPHPDSEALDPALRRSHASYPIVDRTYDLRRLPGNAVPSGDFWVIDLSYEEIAAYYPAMTFPPQQRVAFAAELFDNRGQASPQLSLQSLPIVNSMNRLTIPPAAARVPIVLRTSL